MAEQRRKYFKPDDPIEKALESDWLNSLESRIKRVEDMIVGDGLHIEKNPAVMAISLEKRIDNFEFVQLAEKLKKLEDADAHLLRLDMEDPSNVSEDTELKIKVKDIWNVEVKDDTRGMAFKHPKSPKGEWIFLHIPEAPPIGWARTLENWRHNFGDSRVWAKKVVGGRNSVTTEGEPFWVYLPRDGADRDPNVVAGKNITYMLDDTDERICTSPYLDAKIGSSMLWTRPKGEVPIGWAVMNGFDNVGPWGSGIITAFGTDRYYLRGVDDDNWLGVNDPGIPGPVQLPPHTAAEVVACIQAHDSAIIAQMFFDHTIVDHPAQDIVNAIQNHPATDTDPKKVIFVDPITTKETVVQFIDFPSGGAKADFLGTWYTMGEKVSWTADVACTTEPVDPHSGQSTERSTTGLDFEGHDHDIVEGVWVNSGEEGAFVADVVSTTSVDKDTIIEPVGGLGHDHGLSTLTHEPHTHSVQANDLNGAKQLAHAHIEQAIDHNSNQNLHTHTIEEIQIEGAQGPGHQHDIDANELSTKQVAHFHTVPVYVHLPKDDVSHGVSKILEHSAYGLIPHYPTEEELKHPPFDIIPPHVFLYVIERINNAADAI